MTEVLNFITDNQQSIATLVTLILAIVKIIRDKVEAKNALMLLLNSLKNENQMAGNQFTKELLEKVQSVAEIQKVSQDTLKEVVETIEKPRDGLKIGSYKGKAIYVQDVGVVSTAISTVYNAVKGLFKRR